MDDTIRGRLMAYQSGVQIRYLKYLTRMLFGAFDGTREKSYLMMGSDHKVLFGYYFWLHFQVAPNRFCLGQKYILRNWMVFWNQDWEQRQQITMNNFHMVCVSCINGLKLNHFSNSERSAIARDLIHWNYRDCHVYSGLLKGFYQARDRLKK